MPRKTRGGLTPAEVARLGPAAQAQINQQLGSDAPQPPSNQQQPPPQTEPQQQPPSNQQQPPPSQVRPQSTQAQRDLQARLHSSEALLRQTASDKAIADAARGTPQNQSTTQTPQPPDPSPVQVSPTGPVEKPNGPKPVIDPKATRLSAYTTPLKQMLSGLDRGITPDRDTFFTTLQGMENEAQSLGPASQNYVRKYIDDLKRNPKVLAAFPELGTINTQPQQQQPPPLNQQQQQPPPPNQQQPQQQQQQPPPPNQQQPQQPNQQQQPQQQQPKPQMPARQNPEQPLNRKTIDQVLVALARENLRTGVAQVHYNPNAKGATFPQRLQRYMPKNYKR